MREYIVDLLEQTLGNELLVTLIISMIPVIELRGAIPVGIGMLGLNPWVAMLVSIFGNMIPVPFIILFIRRIFAWMRRHLPRLEGLVTRLEQRAEGKTETVNRYKLIGLAIFVAIPLPGTGAWTGALVAAMMNLRLKTAVPAIFLGVIIAGFLVMGLTVGFRAIF